MENKRWWSKEKREWYERAAAYSAFHRTLASEIEPYIDFLDKTFGKNKMKECTEYLLRLKKLA